MTHSPVSGKAVSMSDLLAGAGLVQDYFHFSPRAAGQGRLHQYWTLTREIRTWGPQVMVYLHEQRGLVIAVRDWLLFRMMGITRMIGIPLTPRLQELRHNEHTGLYESRTEYLARSLATLGTLDTGDPGSWDLALTAAETAKAEQVLVPVTPAAGLIVMSIGTKVEVNDWGDVNWRALITQLDRELTGCALVAIGAQVEHQRSQLLLDGWNGPRLNLCGALQVRESAALLRRANVFMGHDSGPMHLAAAVGTRCVVIFSARNLPGRWFPFGAGHQVLYHKTDCAGCLLSVCMDQGKKCIYGITPTEVTAAVLAAIAPKTAKAP